MQGLDVLLAIETWIFIVVIWAGSLWIARGTWRPLADTTAAFVEVSIRRREANLRGATFGACAYVVQVVFVVLALGVASPVGVWSAVDVGVRHRRRLDRRAGRSRGPLLVPAPATGRPRALARAQTPAAERLRPDR